MHRVAMNAHPGESGAVRWSSVWLLIAAVSSGCGSGSTSDELSPTGGHDGGSEASAGGTEGKPGPVTLGEARGPNPMQAWTHLPMLPMLSRTVRTTTTVWETLPAASATRHRGRAWRAPQPNRRPVRSEPTATNKATPVRAAVTKPRTAISQPTAARLRATPQFISALDARPTIRARPDLYAKGLAACLDAQHSTRVRLDGNAAVQAVWT